MNNIKNYYKISKKQKGFTLVELMVSLMLFTIVVLAAVGSLYTVNNASRKVQAMRSVLDNLTFGIESISRTIRTGNSVKCVSLLASPNCSFQNQNPGTGIVIDSTLGTAQLVEYRLGSNPDGTGVIQKRTQESGLWTNWFAITSPEINVQQLSFYVSGAELSESEQTNVSIFIKGIAVAGQDNAPFAVQTYVSQRVVK
jgi:prepilin-type N-terminal cleavage/methylation domain-containing protein